MKTPSATRIKEGRRLHPCTCTGFSLFLLGVLTVMVMLPISASGFSPTSTGTRTSASTIAGASVSSVQKARRIRIDRFHSTCLNSTTNTNEQSQTTARKLTNQERILKEALGIEPETPAEREKRIQRRIDKANEIINEKRKSIAVAALAFAAAILNYGWQYTHPITSLSLLSEMQRNSADLNVIGHNGKPTVVDFWAPWCENCKVAAPTLAAIEEEYKGEVNFVMVRGDTEESYPIVGRFGVDAIPHLAIIGSDGVVETALIGPIPRNVLRADLDVLLENSKRIPAEGETVAQKQKIPYTMYDAFRNRPDLRQVSFQNE